MALPVDYEGGQTSHRGAEMEGHSKEGTAYVKGKVMQSKVAA